MGAQGRPTEVVFGQRPGRGSIHRGSIWRKTSRGRKRQVHAQAPRGAAKRPVWLRQVRDQAGGEEAEGNLGEL